MIRNYWFLFGVSAGALLLLGSGCQTLSDYAAMGASLAESLSGNAGFIGKVGDAAGANVPVGEISLWSGLVATALRLVSKVTAEPGAVKLAKGMTGAA